MQKYYLAIDIGASSGRHIVGWREDGEIRTREVYRFPNGVQEENGHLAWDVEALVREVKAGIRAAKAEFPEIESLSIDTWGRGLCSAERQPGRPARLCLPGQPDRSSDSKGTRESTFLRIVPPHRLPVPALQFHLSALCR